MVFNFTCRDNEGRTIRGTVDASNSKEAAVMLRQQGFFVVYLNERGVNPLTSVFKRFRRVTFGDIVNFTRQLSSMITAGLTLPEALRILEQQTESVALRTLLFDMLHEVEGGKSFAATLERYSQFSKTYVSVVRAGEASGTLDKVLQRLADNLEKERALRSKIKAAMIYPAIIVIVMVIVATIMMVVVIPKMLDIYKDFDATLPTATKVLINISGFVSRFWWIFAAALVGLFLFFSSWRRTDFGKEKTDSLYFKIPILGNLKKQQILAEFSRTLGLLVGAGVPLVGSLNIVADAVGSVKYQRAIAAASQQIEKGYPLSSLVGQDPQLFPPILSQMVKVGEETGKMDETLLKVSVYFEASVDNAVKALTTAIEPLIIVVLGLGVGFLVIAVIMPIYNLTSSIK